MSNFLLIFVCTGNICRSPIAEGIMKDIVIDEFDSKKAAIPIEVMSAGTHAPAGSGASGFAIEIAKSHGINLSFHRSRVLIKNIANAADLILTMERYHTEHIKQLWPQIDNVYELKNFNRNELLPDNIADIDDPIGMSFEVYSKIYNEINEELKRVSGKIFSLALEKKRER